MLYTERQKMAAEIIGKIRAGKKLTEDEVEYVWFVLTDPLQEFCMREGTFRLVEMHGVDPAKATEMEFDAAEAVRDTIDYDENLYDKIDDEIRNIANK